MIPLCKTLRIAPDFKIRSALYNVPPSMINTPPASTIMRLFPISSTSLLMVSCPVWEIHKFWSDKVGCDYIWERLGEVFIPALAGSIFYLISFEYPDDHNEVFENLNL